MPALVCQSCYIGYFSAKKTSKLGFYASVGIFEVSLACLTPTVNRLRRLSLLAHPRIQEKSLQKNLQVCFFAFAFSYICDMNKFDSEIEVTADGSATLYRADIDEHYHSVKGALTESSHVYINSALHYRVAAGDCSEGLTLLEIGFGTGLNAAMSVGAVDIPLRYVALELYPLSADVVEAMGYDSTLPYITAVNNAQWDSSVAITPSFILEKRIADFLSCELPQGVDVVYFDAFAPEKQPEMWSRECFERVYAAMNLGGVLTTYCAKGIVRRLLQEVGFTVQRIEGPVGGKREILRAIKDK